MYEQVHRHEPLDNGSGDPDEDVDMQSDKEAPESDEGSEVEFPTKLMGFQKASLHKPEDFTKLDKKVRQFFSLSFPPHPKSPRKAIAGTSLHPLTMHFASIEVLISAMQ